MIDVDSIVLNNDLYIFNIKIIKHPQFAQPINQNWKFEESCGECLSRRSTFDLFLDSQELCSIQFM